MDDQNDKLRSRAYDEVIMFRDNSFLHFRIDRYKLPLSEVIVLYLKDKNITDLSTFYPPIES